MTNAILQPKNDKREYRHVVLENSLSVLLINDEETDKAAAAMAVNVGYYKDPEEIPGLAHFLEHMLFYSSEKYPLEDSYSIFLNEHGGHSNAYTSSEYTNYHFEVNHDYLDEALDRFAQFFICPLMSADATNREMNAVHSEHCKNLNSDPWRQNQLLKSLTSPSHPYHKFGTGNLETLDTIPKSKGIDVRQSLIDFYQEYYSANIMALVVYGKEPLDVLEKVVTEKFSAVVNKNVQPIRFEGSPCSPEHLQVLVKSVPVSEGHSLDLNWPIPPGREEYQKGVTRYLGHLLGHEADGSLFALLKKKGWATGLSAGESESSWNYSFFSVSVELTDLGQENINEILALVFDYISILANHNGVSQWIFDELRSVCETKFHFQDKRSTFSYVSSIAANMMIYPPEDCLAGPSLPRTYDSAAIEKVLHCLTPQNTCIVWSSKQLDSPDMQTEPWYGTRYILTKLDTSNLTGREACPELSLPQPNVFIPTDFSIKSHEGHPEFPVPVHTSPMTCLWFKPDTKFSSPKANVFLNFHSPAAYDCPESAAMARIFTKLVSDYLNQHAYYAEIAGLSYSIQSTSLGFQVLLSGYSHKICLLAQTIIDTILSFTVLPDRFGDVKEKVEKDYLNWRYEQPYRQALYRTSESVEAVKWNIQEYLQVLPGVTPARVALFVPRLLSRFFLEAYVTGNLTEGESVAVVRGVERSFAESAVYQSEALFGSQLSERRVLSVPATADGLVFPYKGLNPDDPNSALLFHIQVGPESLGRSPETMKSQLLVQALNRDAFHQLRSVEQLGYIVFLVPRDDYGVHGIQFILQSSVKDAGALEERVESFLELAEGKIEGLTEEEFQTHVSALVASKEEKHKSLNEEAKFFWREIENGTLQFDRVKNEVETLKALSAVELRTFFLQYVKKGGEFRKKLSTQIYGGAHVDAFEAVVREASEKENIILDVPSFKRAQSLYGSFTGLNLTVK